MIFILCSLFIFIFASLAFADPSEDLFNLLRQPTVTAEEVNTLIAAGADVNYRSEEGNSILMLAVSHSKEIVKSVIEAGADVNFVIPKKTSIKCNALMLAAAQTNNPEIISLLLEKGADINIKDYTGCNALMYAAKRNKNPEVTQIIDILINAGIDVNAKNKILHLDALMIAAKHLSYSNNNPAIIPHLIKVGADVNARDFIGRTALMYLTELSQFQYENIEKHYENIKLLIDAGTDVNIRDEYGRTAIIDAAMSEAGPKIIELLIKAGADVNAKDRRGITPLSTSVYHSDLETVKLLVNAGADVNTKDENGNNILMAAVDVCDEDTDLDTIKYLIENVADINAKNNKNETALILAAQGGDLEVMKYLVEAGADMNVQENNYGITAFMFAAGKPDLEAAKFLMKAGADINAVTFNGCPVLKLILDVLYYREHTNQIHDEERTKALAVMNMLIECGVDVNAQDDEGKTALTTALREPDSEVIELLLKAGANINAVAFNGCPALKFILDVLYYREDTNQIHDEERTKALAVMNMLIEYGVDVNAQDNKGKTALTTALQESDYEVIELLLKAGANANKANKDGRTSLMLESLYHDKAIIKMLIEYGADVNAQDNYGTNALMLAASTPDLEITKMLLKAGADINAVDRYGNKVISFIINQLCLNFDSDEDYSDLSEIRDELEETINALIEAGTDINAQNNLGETALMLAVKIFDSEITKMLIRADANVNATDKNGNAALSFMFQQLALRYESFPYVNKGVVNALIEAGADINAQNNRGETALMHAVRVSDSETIRWLINAGADVNIKAYNGDTAILYALILLDYNNEKNETAFYEYVEEIKKVIDILIDACTDVNTKNEVLISASHLYKTNIEKNLSCKDLIQWLSDKFSH